ncbi:MAG: DASH family cryptochrome [Pseudomonadota bacterium]
MTKKYQRGLYWFSQDLRLNDNSALTIAQQQCEQLAYCYVIDKQALTRGRYGMPSLGKHRLRFIMQSLVELEKQLAAAGHQFIVLNGEPLEELSALISEYRLDAVFGGRAAGIYEQRRWQQLEKRFPYLSFQQIDNSTLFSEHQLPCATDNLPASFSQFRKLVEPLSESLPGKQLNNPDFDHKALVINKQHILPQMPEQSEALVEGGELAAAKHMQQYFSSSAPARYKQTRNALEGFDQSTKLSAWLASGNLSPQQVVNQVRDYEQQYGANDSTYWILFELLWREYFFWYLIRHQHKVFTFKGLADKRPTTSFYPGRFKQWCEGNTPYPLVNACMKQLNETGYLSNRGRQIVASCLINELSLDWRYGAAHFEQQLIDYDVASNWGNWQYIAGVGADPRGGRHFNLQKQTDHFDPKGQFIAQWRGNKTSALDHNDAADWPVVND